MDTMRRLNWRKNVGEKATCTRGIISAMDVKVKMLPPSGASLRKR